MKKLIAIALVSFLGTTAVLAQAPRSNRNVHPKQPKVYHQDRYAQNSRRQDPGDRQILGLQNDIRMAINHGVETRQLSQKQAKKYLREYDKISQQEIKLRAKNGLNNREEKQLVQELMKLKSQVYAQVNVRDSKRTMARW